MPDEGRVYPVIMCGGSGTRLWPLSRKLYPKQFLALTGSETLFQQTLGRLAIEGISKPIVPQLVPVANAINAASRNTSVGSQAESIVSLNMPERCLSSRLWHLLLSPPFASVLMPSLLLLMRSPVVPGG